MLPSAPDVTRCLVVGERIVFVTIPHDHDATNPTEHDGFGAIRSLNHKHINSIDYDEAEELLRSDPDVIPLSYFEHGNSLWMVMGGAAPAGVEFQWDGVRFAGIWIPDRYVRESYTGQDGLSRRAWMVKQAEAACEEYTKWANGEAYGYRIAVYTVRRDATGEPYDHEDDYRRDTPLAEDSCYGFLGWDVAEAETRSALQAMSTQLKLGLLPTGAAHA